MKNDLISQILQLKDKHPQVLGSDTYHTFSILLPLIKINEDIHVIFETRAQHLRRQPGEICFPGGRIDQEDESSEYAAIRETCEELQLTHEEVKLIGPLNYFVSPFETIIYPYVGWIEKEWLEISPNPAEVGKIFSVPLSHLIQSQPEIYNVRFKVQPDHNFPFNLIPDGENYKWQDRKTKEYFYYYEDKVIWGLTARILHEFLKIFN